MWGKDQVYFLAATFQLAGALADADNTFAPVQPLKTCYYAKSLIIPQKENTKMFACAEKICILAICHG